MEKATFTTKELLVLTEIVETEEEENMESFKKLTENPAGCIAVALNCKNPKWVGITIFEEGKRIAKAYSVPTRTEVYLIKDDKSGKVDATVKPSGKKGNTIIATVQIDFSQIK
jgi:hypothetical protein